MPARIEREDVQRLMREGALLVEVLPAGEFGEAHLPGAINIPLEELRPERVADLSRERPLVTYCYDTQCDMSPRAAWRLETLGFRRVYHYAPGKADWMGAGLPVEGEASDLPMIGQLAVVDVPTCELEQPLEDVRRRLVESGWDSCFVVNAEKVVLGRIYRTDLEGARRDLRAADVMDPGPSTYRPNVTAVEMAERMREEDLETAPVTSSDGRLIGVVLRREVELAAQSAPDVQLTDENPAAG